MSESAPRIPEKAVLTWAKRQLEQGTGGAEDWSSLSEKRAGELLSYAREDLTAILPLLCGEPPGLEKYKNWLGKELAHLEEHEDALTEYGQAELYTVRAALNELNRLVRPCLPLSGELVEEREELYERLKQADTNVKASDDDAARARNRAEKAEQEAERLRADRDEKFVVANRLLDERKEVEARLSQVREEVEKAERNAQLGNGGELEDPLANIKAILDSSPSLSGGGESSGVAPRGSLKAAAEDVYTALSNPKLSHDYVREFGRTKLAAALASTQPVSPQPDSTTRIRLEVTVDRDEMRDFFHGRDEDLAAIDWAYYLRMGDLRFVEDVTALPATTQHLVPVLRAVPTEEHLGFTLELECGHSVPATGAYNAEEELDLPTAVVCPTCQPQDEEER